jgi:hypothetical protein
MLAAAIEKGVISLAELTLEEWQWAMAYFEGIEDRRKLKQEMGDSRGDAIVGSSYSPEEMLQRIK